MTASTPRALKTVTVLATAAGLMALGVGAASAQCGWTRPRHPLAATRS